MVELKAAFTTLSGSTTQNRTVFIPGNISIDFSNEQSPLTIPQGVTLASDRGNNGSKGALLHSSSIRPTPLFNIFTDNVKITGFRLRGPHMFIQDRYTNLAISAGDKNGDFNINSLEIYNMELYNWSYAAIALRKGVINAQIHHNSIHHNQRHGLGYGVVLNDNAKAIIHHNLFDSNRHSIAGNGAPGQGYEAHSNIVFANSNGHSFDMHGYFETKGPEDSDIAGEYVNIHDNTFLLDHNAIVIRGIPTSSVSIRNNSFSNINEDTAIRQTVRRNSVLNQLYQGGLNGFNVLNNTYGQSGNIRYADLETDNSALKAISNDAFWAMPGSTPDENDNVVHTWYTSIDANQPWKRLGNSTTPPSQLRVMDFTSDGVADVFKATGSQWLISSSANSLWSDLNSSEISINSLIFADINGDGTTDVVHKSQKYISWDGSSSWVTNQLHDDVDFNDSSFILDVNNDGQSDVVKAVGTSFQVSWGGTTAFETVIGNRAFIHSGFAHGDFDGDGKKDTFRINATSWQVRYFGSSIFQDLSSGHTETLADIAVGDFNGDGKSDIFRINDRQWQYSSAGEGPWVDLQTSGLPLSRLAFGDFNGDGKTDIFYRSVTTFTTDTDETKTKIAWKASWGGTTSWALIGNSDIAFSRLIFSDFNGDGRTDVAKAGNGAISISLGGSQLWSEWQP